MAHHGAERRGVPAMAAYEEAERGGRSGDGGAGAAPPAGPAAPHAVRDGGGRESLCEFIWV